MKRRRLLAGLGTLAAGTAVGTGAFTSVDAERSVTVSVATEDSAYLALESTISTQAVYTREGTNGEVSIFFNDRSPTNPDTGDGIGVDSTYTFDDLVKVTNKGTQTVYLKAPVRKDDTNTSGLSDAYFYVAEASSKPLDGDENGLDGESENETWLKLAVGESAQLGFFMDSNGAETNTYGLVSEILATSTEPANAVDSSGTDV